nr:uncharacterized protein LOC119621910 isoform X1 [Chlorocebus sabaeus]
MWLLLPPEGALGEELQVPQQSMAASWLNLGWIKKYVGEALQQQENCERHKHLPIESYETPSMDHYETPVAEHLGTPTTNLLPRPQVGQPVYSAPNQGPRDWGLLGWEREEALGGGRAGRYWRPGTSFSRLGPGLQTPDPPPTPLY